ncbi:putative u1 zinc finger domain-containing protein [Phaeoacremonium minimum UCRPA7]|uniref:Putative u1 zinc finger domain-containing protein n=1 Tax=Phaeoacremonium minimum (strain UCR-PA7) TaxID=1286976 RepID=R8BD21_PHAM7|nr:putative u1 zinc finger domain-containing protein [Phaeoacremonium minimum UCRPA7]EON97203.1 putative u1 zinc finger domain-containing protein [Phaeoacremonium minimum UCRPA7]
MSEYWKSTPRYWCKHCSTYVRDTKLERQNHESTAKHQGAVKRALRDLHRGHEREERDKERAKREIDRLNGVVGSSSSTSASGAGLSSSRPNASGGGGASRGPSTEAERQRQMEQLAAMGVSIPDQFRGDMAMAGEWTVTNTRVIKAEDENGKTNIEAKALGVRKHERTEEQREEENAVNGLFKKPRRWGRDSRAMPEDDADLDALLSGSLVKKEPKQDTDDVVKQEEPVDTKIEEPLLERPEDAEIKKESSEEEGVPNQTPKSLLPTTSSAPEVKEEEGATPEPISVTFKKRKSKNIRQK